MFKEQYKKDNDKLHVPESVLERALAAEKAQRERRVRLRRRVTAACAAAACFAVAAAALLASRRDGAAFGKSASSESAASVTQTGSAATAEAASDAVLYAEDATADTAYETVTADAENGAPSFAATADAADGQGGTGSPEGNAAVSFSAASENARVPDADGASVSGGVIVTSDTDAEGLPVTVVSVPAAGGGVSVEQSGICVRASYADGTLTLVTRVSGGRAHAAVDGTSLKELTLEAPQGGGTLLTGVYTELGTGAPCCALTVE